jgi:methylmalonyl-CoA/ethylmalonyl-CoA epimerase
MTPSRIEHIGIAVKSISAARKYYEEVLGLACYAIEEVPEQKVRTAFFRIGESKIELLEPTDPESAVAKYIEKRGEGLHHIAFAVDDIGGALSHAGTMGVQLIDNVPRHGAEGLQIAFLHPKSTGGVLTELCSEVG